MLRKNTWKRLCGGALAAILCLAPTAVMAAPNNAPAAITAAEQAETASLSVAIEGDALLHILDSGMWRGIAPGENTADLTLGESQKFQVTVEGGWTLESVTLDEIEMECEDQGDGTWTFTTPPIEGDCDLVVVAVKAGESASLSVSVEGDAVIHMLDEGKWFGVVPGQDAASLLLGETPQFSVYVGEGQTLGSVTWNGVPVDCEPDPDRGWTFTAPEVTGDCELVVTTVQAGQTASLSVAIDGSAQLHMRDGGVWRGVAPGDDTADLPLGASQEFQVTVEEGWTLALVTLNGNTLECEDQGDGTWTFATPTIQGDCEIVVLAVETEDVAWLSVDLEGCLQVQALQDGAWGYVAEGENTMRVPAGDRLECRVVVPEGWTLQSVTLNGNAIECEERGERSWTFITPAINLGGDLAVKAAVVGEAASLTANVDLGANLRILVGDVWETVVPGISTMELPVGQGQVFEVDMDHSQTLASVTVNGSPVDCEAGSYQVWHFTIPEVEGDCTIDVTTSPNPGTTPLSLGVDGNATVRLKGDGSDAWTVIEPGQGITSLVMETGYSFEVQAAEGQMLASATLDGTPLACEYRGESTWTFDIKGVRDPAELDLVLEEGAAGKSASMSLDIAGTCDVQIQGPDGAWTPVEPNAQSVAVETGSQYGVRVVAANDQCLVSATLDTEFVTFERELDEAEDHATWEMRLPIVTGDCELALTLESVEDVRQKVTPITSATPAGSVLGVIVPEPGETTDVMFQVETDAPSVVWCVFDTAFRFHLVPNADGDVLRSKEFTLRIPSQDLVAGAEKMLDITAVALVDGWISDDPGIDDVRNYMYNLESVLEGGDGIRHDWSIVPVWSALYPELAVSPDSSLELNASTGYVTGLTLEEPQHNLASEVAEQFVHNLGTRMDIVGVDGTPMAADAHVATGSRVQMSLENGTDSSSAIFVVRGDVLGTGTMSLTQLVRMADAFRGTQPLEGPYLAAGDLNGDGQITISDLVLEVSMYR